MHQIASAAFPGASMHVGQKSTVGAKITTSILVPHSSIASSMHASYVPQNDIDNSVGLHIAQPVGHFCGTLRAKGALLFAKH